MAVGLNKELRSAMTRIAAGLPTKSAKIRALGKAGYERADIARFLNIRYQHVRNVELQAREKEKRQGQPENAARPPAQMWAPVGADGRVVIPAAFRQVLGIEDGGHVLLLREDDELRLLGREGAVRRAQAMVAPYLKDESTSVDSFLAERRREARREELKDRRRG
jgi:bifunctional DNA-binding transcriptional regulator/antitoxin component of YhaV-PrlF toxin-antitoxin module